MESGILLINKPIDWTSRDVINYLMKRFHDRKIGHSGTLDPFASGLLVVATNKATKIVPYLEMLDKEYEATLKLGEKSSTGDTEGEIIERKDIPTLNIELIQNVLYTFLGEQTQIPPMYSAIRVNGRQLYKYARNGEEVERKERKITISSIELLSFENNIIKFKCTVSKGTYIRTLGEDVASRLGTVGHLIELKRTRVGKYNLKDAKEMNEVTDNDILPILNSLDHLPTSYVSGSFEPLVRHGQPVHYSRSNEPLILFRTEDELIAIYERHDDGIYYCKRGLV